MKDVLIIGAGPAGLAAAIYAQRAGLQSVMFDKGFYGGQASLTMELENYPAIKKISGAEFAQQLFEHATHFGAEFIMEEVTGVELQGDVKRVHTTSNTYEGKTVIISNGVRRRKLGCPGEEEFAGRGVSYCATCDGAFFKGKDVAIVGGGSTALEDALFLSNHCNKVTLVHRRDEFRGEYALVKAVNERDNIEILYSSAVDSIVGENKVEKVNIKNLKDNSVLPIDVSGVFIAIGYEPDNEIYAGQLKTTESGYFIADETCETEIPGVFVAGDCREKHLRQVITAAADGASAAFGAANYLNLR